MPRFQIVPALAAGMLALGACVGSGDARQQPAIPPGPTSVTTPAAPGSSTPNLTVSPDGRVYMSWVEPADSGHALRFSVYDGEKWNAPRTIRQGRDFFVNWADFPSIEALDNDRLAAHWLQRTGRGTYAYGVRVSRSSNGGATWSAPVTPHRDNSLTEHGFVAMWPEGGTVGAVWLDGRKYDKEGHHPSNEMMLASTTIDARGRLGAEVTLDPRTCDCCQNTAAMTSQGPIVAYRDRSPDEIRDIYIVRRVNGRWTAPARVHPDNWHIAACPVNGPAIAAQGRFVALAWFTAANDSPRVKVAFSRDAGASFASPVGVDGGVPAGRVDASLLPGERALVSWLERVGGDTAAVRARVVRRDGSMGPTITVATSSAARAGGFPRMAVTRDFALFAWTLPGRTSSIQAARIPLSELR